MCEALFLVAQDAMSWVQAVGTSIVRAKPAFEGRGGVLCLYTRVFCKAAPQAAVLGVRSVQDRVAT